MTTHRDRLAMAFWTASALVLTFDLATKALVRKSLVQADAPIEVIGEWLRVYHLRNSGGLFGVMPGNAVYFAVVSAIAFAVILYLVYRSDYRTWRPRVALGMILGGALGNFHDRIRYDGVVDFIDIGFGSVRWPTFNIADAGVTIGVGWLAWWLFRGDPSLRPEEISASDDDPASQPGSVDGWS